MPVLINFKICDNAKECNGIAACPTGALSWNKIKKEIKVDNTKCVSCGKCEVCGVGAIHVARNQEEYDKIKKEIDSDPRKLEDLFIDRYGASPINLPFLIEDKHFQIEVAESSKLTVAEIFKEDSIECLLKSIPIKDLFRGIDIKYRKVNAKNEELLNKYKIEKLPTLIFFKEGKLLGKVEGYYDNKKKEGLIKKIKLIIKN